MRREDLRQLGQLARLPVPSARLRVIGHRQPATLAHKGGARTASRDGRSNARSAGSDKTAPLRSGRFRKSLGQELELTNEDVYHNESNKRS